MTIHSYGGEQVGKPLNFSTRVINQIDKLPEKRKRRVETHVLKLLRMLSIFDEAYTGYLRFLVSRLLSWDPLSGSSSNFLSYFLLTTEKDLAVLPLSLYSVSETLVGDQEIITIVCPQKDLHSVRMVTDRLQSLGSFVIRSDESILKQYGLKRSDFPNSHSLMQVMKFLCSLVSSTNDCLVLDGDTIYLRNKIWSSGENMTLIVPPEYNKAHVNFVKANFGTIRHSRLGFTTQSQIIRQSLVVRLIETVGGLDKFVNIFTSNMARSTETCFPCEWQVYGDWVYSTLDQELTFSSYLNKSLPRTQVIKNTLTDASIADLTALFEALRSQFLFLGSLSLHAYKH